MENKVKADIFSVRNWRLVIMIRAIKGRSALILKSGGRSKPIDATFTLKAETYVA